MSSGERNGASRALPLVGQVIGGKYEIVRVLGEGGMGVVFEAKHLKLHQRVAVKMLLPDMLAHEVIVSRFEREARASGQLRNRHTARVMDVDVTSDGLPYMVMEFLEGHDLQTELDMRERLPVDEAVEYVLQACSAMLEAHQLGIVHRDLKPANLFLALDSNSTDASAGRIVKVLDFGISKVQAEGDVKLTVAETVIGTAMYMSPEQVRSSGTVDRRTDIWSLGIILFELVAGRPPWIGSPTQLAALIVSEDAPDVRSFVDVPAELAAIIAKALKRDASQRYDDVKQLAKALTPLAAPGKGFPSSSRFARVTGPLVGSGRPEDLGDANTLLNAPAISESRAGAGPGTTPGWTQSGQPAPRNRRLLFGFVGAFVVGLLLLGGFATLGGRAPTSTAAGGAGASSSTVPSAASAAGSEKAAAAGAVGADPLPPAVDPTPPATAAAPSAAPSASVAAARPRVVPHAASSAPHPAPVTAAPPQPAPVKPAAPPVTAGPGSNPIHL